MKSGRCVNAFCKPLPRYVGTAVESVILQPVTSEMATAPNHPSRMLGPTLSVSLRASAS